MTTGHEQPRARPGAQELHPALARLLHPLVRLLIRSGITFPALTELLREVYVSVADKEFTLETKGQTDSRVSILTGIHRKEVRRLREAGAPVNEVPAIISRGSRILAHWLGSPMFQDTDGKPLALPRIPDGTGPSFDDLVQAETRDIRPRAILDEWLSQGLVRIDSENCVVLDQSAFIPSHDASALAYYFGRNMHDHLAAAVSNLDGVSAPFLERAVHYDGLNEHQAQILEKKARDLAFSALKAANREALAVTKETTTGIQTPHSLEQAESHAKAGGNDAPEPEWRWTFGTYVFREKVDKTP